MNLVTKLAIYLLVTSSMNNPIPESTINPQAWQWGCAAYNKLSVTGHDKQQILTIVDFTKPSNEPRMYIIDMKHNNVIMTLYVAHGKNSGETYAREFSNEEGSDKSSIGTYLTLGSYEGKHGYSLRLKGLEHSNSNVEVRDIVVHSAIYVTNTWRKEHHGEIGRSWGCFALDPAKSEDVINLIKNDTVLYAYYPDPYYKSTSEYIK